MTVRARALLVAVTVCAIAGCAGRDHTGTRTPDARAPRLPDADSLGAPFLARQRVVATANSERHGFEAVLQYDGRELLLLGLTPMGTKAFAVRQRGTVATAETYVDRPLPAPATAILLDVHWAYFLATGAAGDGWHRRRMGGLRVRERWHGGRLQERIVTPHRGIAVHITYVGGHDVTSTAGFPKDVVVEHVRAAAGPDPVDLRLEITTLTYESIATR